MKRIVVVALVCLTLSALAVTGCKEDSKPVITRAFVLPSCGVIPLEVECYAVTSGGNESGDPTGGNASLAIDWSFGDGSSSQTSIAYHTYETAGDYTVTITARDEDGNSVSHTVPVVALQDSLQVEASSNFPGGNLTTADELMLDFRARSCAIDPDMDGDYVNLDFEWRLEGPISHVFLGRSPSFTLPTAGDYTAEVIVRYPAWACTRRDTLFFTVTTP